MLRNKTSFPRKLESSFIDSISVSLEAIKVFGNHRVCPLCPPDREQGKSKEICLFAYKRLAKPLGLDYTFQRAEVVELVDTLA